MSELAAPNFSPSTYRL